MEANNSKSVQFVADNSTVESWSLSVSVSTESKKLKTCRSLVEANYANEDIQIKTLRNTHLLVLRQSQLPLETVCA